MASDTDRDPARDSARAKPLERELDAYDPERERPLSAYTAITAVFSAVSVAALVALEARGKGPRKVSPLEAIRIGVATHKLARLLAKDKVTSAYRAPFVRFESAEDAAPAEVSERPRGQGLRYALGELAVCPYCLAPWIATAFHLARRIAPERTGLVIAILESVTVADFLQIIYKGSESKLL